MAWYSNPRKMVPIRKLAVIVIIAVTVGCIPRSGPSNLEKAKTLETEEPGEARRLLMEIIQQNPQSEIALEAHYRLGLLHLESGKPSVAIEHFKQAVDISIPSPYRIAASIELLGIEYSDQSGTYDEIQTLIDGLKNAVKPMNTVIQRGLFYMAKTAFSTEDWDSVLSTVDACDTRFLDTDLIIRLKYYQGVALGRLNQRSRAIEVLTSILGPENPWKIATMSELIELYMASDDPMGAVQLAFDDPISLTNENILTRVGDILSKSMTLESLESLRETYGTGFTGLLIRFEIARKYQLQGDVDQALTFLDELKRTYPDYSRTIEAMIDDMREMTRVYPEKIGLLTPLSGPLASIGQSIYRGVQLAVADYRDAGGTRMFTLTVRDTGSASELQAIFEDLALTERVIAVIGPVKSSETEELIPLCDELMVPLLTPGCPDNGVVSESDWAFRLFPSPEIEMRHLIRFSARDLGLTRFGCLYPDIDYGHQATVDLIQIAADEAIDLVFLDKYPADLTGIRSIIARHRMDDLDVILIPDSAERASVVAGQVRYQELLTPTIAGIGAWDDPLLLQVAGNNLESSYFVSQYPMAHGFRNSLAERYNTMFGEAPDAFSMRAYEAMFLVIQAVESDIRYRPQLKEFLSSDNGVEGLDGRAWFNDAGDYRPPLTIYRVEGSTYHPWRVIPADRHLNLRAVPTPPPPMADPLQDPLSSEIPDQHPSPNP